MNIRLPQLTALLLMATTIAAQDEKHAHSWWHDGFPGVVKDAPWWRCTETPDYSLVVNTETCELLHLSSGLLPDNVEAWKPATLQMQIIANGEPYHLTGTSGWSKTSGPRMISTGRFLQREDITGLTFTNAEGEPLPADIRLESAAWQDRLRLSLACRPLPKPLSYGPSFGSRQGGQIVGTGHKETIAAENWQHRGAFSLDFQIYLPIALAADDKKPDNVGWIVCKGRNEQSKGHFGIVRRHNGDLQLTVNPQGGAENVKRQVVPARLVPAGKWHKIEIVASQSLIFRINGTDVIGQTLSKAELRLLEKPDQLTFGGRGDGFVIGSKMRFGLDEVSLTKGQHQFYNSFDADGFAAGVQPFHDLKITDMILSMTNGKGKKSTGTFDHTITSWGERMTSLDVPIAELSKPAPLGSVAVKAKSFASETEKTTLPVTIDQATSALWIDASTAPWQSHPNNHSPADQTRPIEISLTNKRDAEVTAPLVIELSDQALSKQGLSPVTGIVGFWEDEDGTPNAHPVQISKNWHRSQSATPACASVYEGVWCHAISQIKLAPRETKKLRFRFVAGNWQGKPAVSLSQLSLIGWGVNQRWDQAALGAQGETICFEPDQIHRDATIMDVRAFQVPAKSGIKDSALWTPNVGGGDLWRIYDAEGARILHRGMRTTYRAHGPAFVETVYSGFIGHALQQTNRIILFQEGELARIRFSLRLDVLEDTEVSRFAVFQLGSEDYAQVGSRSFAIGDSQEKPRVFQASSAQKELRFPFRRNKGYACLTESYFLKASNNIPSDRAVLLHRWDSNRSDLSPALISRPLSDDEAHHRIFEIGSQRAIKKLTKGDFLEVDLDLLLLPSDVSQYLGDDAELRQLLKDHPDSSALTEALFRRGSFKIVSHRGKLLQRHPFVHVVPKQGAQELEIDVADFVGMLPIRFSGLDDGEALQIAIDGAVADGVMRQWVDPGVLAKGATDSGRDLMLLIQIEKKDRVVTVVGP